MLGGYARNHLEGGGALTWLVLYGCSGVAGGE